MIFENREHNNKLDRMIVVLIEGLSAEELWHLVSNKMNNPAKRQMIGEMINGILGGTSPIKNGYMYRKEDE